MKKLFKNIKINKLKLGITFLVFSMFIGFAALNTKLDIIGLTNIAYSGDQDFRIYFSRTFLNDVGKSNIINEEKNAFTFTYTDINHKDADIKYTVKNTSTTYYADVEVSCKARKNDGTTFVYDEDNSISQSFRLEPGISQTNNITLKLPATITTPTTTEKVNLKEYIKSKSIGSDSNLNFSSLTTSGVYESTNTNSGNPVYYYRGTNTDTYNDVIFAEKCWKILRTTENGGVKLIYNGNPVGGTCLALGASLSIDNEDDVIKFSNSTKYNNNAYAGYMYGGLNASDYSSAHKNINESVFKEKIDAWYEKTLLNTVYEQYLSDDVYYNNRTVLTDYSNVTTSEEFEGLGYGTHNTLYESAGRVSSITNTLLPSFKYSNKNDSFTVSDTVNGNGALTYPISMITADELVYAGTTKTGNRSWLYVYGKSMLTLSPVGYYSGSMNFVIQNSSGNLDITPNTSSNSLYILPAITLDSNIDIIGGNGTNTDPFILSSEDTYENSYTCTLTVNEVGSSKEEEATYHSLLDLEVGEEYCFEDECFYTISNDNNGTIKMIAKYNLYVGNIYTASSKFTTISSSDPLYGKQHVTAEGGPIGDGYPRVGTVPYSTNSSNSYANSDIKSYVDAYGTYLREKTGINITSELITVDELLSLGCTTSPVSTCKDAKFDWVTGRSYWTMSPGDTSGKIYLVGADGFFNSTTGMSSKELRGVRPVITISLVEKNPYVSFVSGNGENVGDEMCIGTECFYVLNYNESYYTLFAKYNLYVGNKYDTGSKTVITTSDPSYGRQSPLALGDKGSPIYGTMLYSNTATAINNYANYLNSTYNLHTTGRSISYDELVNTIGCVVNFTASHGCSPTENPSVKYDWVTNTTYWGGDATSGKVYLVGGDGYFGAVSPGTNESMRGARPVIIVPTSDIKKSTIVNPPSQTKYPASWNDNGIFSQYYEQAYEKLNTMTTEEKVGQLLVMSYVSQTDALNAVKNYHVGGVLFFATAFSGKTISGVQTMTSQLQASAKIPLILPVDEEGGRVVRVGSNTNLVADELKAYPNLFKTTDSGTNTWKLASELYAETGNFDLIIKEEQVRNSVLKKLGLNMNFAPVVDIANPPAYISDRSFGQSAELTGEYAKAVVQAGKGSGVSHSLKHFPGYGNNADTHTSSSVDNTSLEELWNTHLVPFVAGIESGAEAVMISHNIVSALDKNYPSSLSPAVHELLFKELGFTGIAITDDLSMAGASYSNPYLKAFKAGNHILLVSSKYSTAHSEILNAVKSGEISMNDLDERVFKVLAWKYYNGMLQ